MAKVVNDNDADDLTKHPAYALGVKHAYAGIAPKPKGFAEGGTADPTDLTNPANRRTGPIAQPAPDPTATPTPIGAPPPTTTATPAPAVTGGGVATVPRTTPTGVVPPRVPPPAARIAGGAPGGQSFVGATPAGNDYNLGTRQYVPKTNPGTINGQPADVIGAASRSGVTGLAGPATLPRTPQVAGPTPAVGGTQAVLPQSKFLPAGRNGASGVVDREERIPGGSQANRLATPKFQEGGRVDPGIGVVDLNKIAVPPATETPKYKAGGKVSKPKPKVNDNDADDYKSGGKVKRYQDGGKARPTPTPAPTPSPPMRNDPATLKRMLNSPGYAEGGEIGTVNLPNISIPPATEKKFGGIAQAPPPRVPNPPDNVPAMLGKGEVVLNNNQKKRVAVQPNFRQGLNPKEQTAMEGMGLPRMRKQTAFKPKPTKMFAGK